MTGKNDGIQKLLQAEKEAAKKVAEAKKKKTEKLKLARIEAQKEIDMEKKAFERDFNAKQNEVLGSRNDDEQKKNNSTLVEIKQIEDMIKENREKAILRLLDMVLNISPVLHTNFRLE